MSQFSGITFKREKPVRLPNPRRKLIVLVLIGALLLAGAGYGYRVYQVIYAVPPPVTMAKKAKTASPATAKKPLTDLSKTLIAAPTNTLAAASDDSPSLGDSLMAVLAPSAHAESVHPGQPAFPSATASQPATLSAKRMPLLVQKRAEKTVPPQPLTAAQQRDLAAKGAFDEIIDKANRNPDIYGFKVSDNLEHARLGEPIRVYQIPESARKNYHSGQAIQPLLEPTEDWFYPVLIGKRVCFMVEVKANDGEYETDTGSRALAIVYQRILQYWPASEGYHPQLVINPHLPTYYFTIPELPTPNITDTSEMFCIYPNLSPADVILASWR